MASYLHKDIQYALRSLRNTPAFTAVVCGVLALGIGANSALFTVVHKVLMEPLPYAEAARLVEVHERVRPRRADLRILAELRGLDA